jgi:hypothetical protein
MTNKPYFGDQLCRDEEFEGKVDFAPEDDEPRINCWLDVECDEETVHYMFVEGAYVRDHVFVDYVEGGHFYRYGWIPEDQIWLEDVMSVVDQVCTGVHETHERYRMKHLGWNYERAHASACVIERKMRKALLEKDVIVPHSEDIAKIFAIEGNGKSCEKFFMDVLQEHMDLENAADKQANNSVGKQEF